MTEYEPRCPGGDEVVAEAEETLRRACEVRDLLAHHGEDPMAVKPAWLAALVETKRWLDALARDERKWTP